MHLSLKSSLGRQYLDNSMGDKLLSEYGGAAAAYSLRSLTGNGGNVVNVRRSSDDAEQAFTAQGVSDGTLVDWVGEDVTIYQSDFSSDADSWVGSGITVDGNQDGVSDGTTSKDNVLKLTKDQDTQSWILRNQGVVAGLTYTVSGSFYVPSTNTAVDSILIKDGTVGTLSTFPSGYLISNGTWTDFSFSYTATVSGPQRINMGVSAEGNATNETVAGSTGDVAYIADLKFVATTADGFVETWYDQSGNGRHAGQSTASSQPKIVDGGALVTDGEGNPSPFFDAIDDFLSVYVGDSTSEFSSFVAASFLLDTSSSGRIVSLTSGENSFIDNISGNIIPHLRNSTNQSVASFSDGFFGISLITYGNLFLHSCIFSAGTASNFLDGLFSGSTSVSYSLTDRRILLGRGEDRYLEGNISCYVLYDADQSANREAIEANIADQYGITLA